MAVTLEEVREYLDSQQINMVDRMVTAIIAKVQAKEPCMTGAGYSDDDVYLLTCYLAALMALSSSSDGRIRSQSAPSGASRSFHYGSTGERWTALSDAVKSLDPAGCVIDLIPKNPDKKARCALFISPGVE